MKTLPDNQIDEFHLYDSKISGWFTTKASIRSIQFIVYDNVTFPIGFEAAVSKTLARAVRARYKKEIEA